MYTDFYGLATEPFENTPDPAFLFPSKSHGEVLASLRYGVDGATGFILITGDIGTGKTTIIRALLKEIDPSYIVLNIINPK
jgi:type II secretory pathway predicted ATPase ExeA